MQPKDDRPDAKARHSNPIHVVEGDARGPARREALRAFHKGLAQAEQNLFNLSHPQRAKAAPKALVAAPRFTVTAEPFDFAAISSTHPEGWTPTPGLVPWTPWWDPAAAASDRTDPRLP